MEEGGGGFGAQQRCVRRKVEEEEESSAAEEEPGDLPEWEEVEEVGFPDFLVGWEAVGEGRKQGHGMEGEEGGLHDKLWMGEVGVELRHVGVEEEEEEHPHHGKGVVGVLGEENNKSG